ncbi:hypothetical protein D7V86_01900 [bacterium D16-51]|nr:hypothetical protein D7V96_01325 [bacterium D16-59]RKI62296.1 hypothetical protein D7V86_01900 [bacterium D16-51]
MPGDRKFIIWGAGKIGEKLVKKYKEIGIEYVLDNNIGKRGKNFFGCTILSPEDIEDWLQYKVIVAADFLKYEDIKKQMKEKGLVEYQDYWSYKNVVNLYPMEELQNQIHLFLKELKEKSKRVPKSILMLGKLNGEHKKNVSLYLNRLAEYDKEHHWIFLSESSFGEQNTWFSSMEVLFMPDLFLQNQYKSDAEVPGIAEDSLEDNLKDAAYAMQFGMDGMPLEYACYICKEAEGFYRQVLEILKPGQVYIWNAFAPLHKVFAKVCAEKGTEVVYVENGVLPGTLAFDRGGQMGESAPAVYCERFCQIPVGLEEREHAKKVLAFLKESGLNRYQQKEDAGFIQSVKDKLLPGRPVVLFAGGLDHMSGLVPHNRKAEKYHSPVFGTSEEAACYLKELARKNGWNLIYKAHPWLPSEMRSEKDGFVCLNKGNINDLIDLSDVVVTIVSQVSYLALIRKKPVIMLGYIQLRQQGCTYEAFKKETVEDVLAKALQDGFQEEMEEAFLTHVARLEKAYLYDDMSDKGIQIGRDISQLTVQKLGSAEEECEW